MPCRGCPGWHPRRGPVAVLVHRGAEGLPLYLDVAHPGHLTAPLLRSQVRVLAFSAADRGCHVRRPRHPAAYGSDSRPPASCLACWPTPGLSSHLAARLRFRGVRGGSGLVGAGATPGISVRLHTEAVGGQDTGRLERLPLRDNRSDGTRAVSAAALFVLVGVSPRTDQALSIAPVRSAAASAAELGRLQQGPVVKLVITMLCTWGCGRPCGPRW